MKLHNSRSLFTVLFLSILSITIWSCSPKTTQQQNVDKECLDPSKVSDGPCTKELRPVCGCNGITYSNKCLAERAGLLKWKSGPCKDSANDNSNTAKDKADLGPDCYDKSKKNITKACPKNYKPVCGCDGKTYANACMAEKMGILSWDDSGPCSNSTSDKDCIDKSKIDKNKVCTQIHDPVCGCDGRTYSNACVAEGAGITKWIKGPCTR